VHIPRAIDRYVREPDLAEQLRHSPGTPSLGAGRGGDGGERGLARERDLVRALDVMTRRADAVVTEEAGDEVVHRGRFRVQ
jgi:hypothetical protein